MTDNATILDGVSADGLSVQHASGMRVALLRYFDAEGGFASHLSAVFGVALPGPGRAMPVDGKDLMLAWRGPRETVVLTSRAQRFEELERHAAGRTDGCLIEQTGGLQVLVLTGHRSQDLLARLGSTTAVPVAGESRAGRIAEVAVTALCVHAGEILLLVERVYTPHLMDWIRVTAADF